MVKLKHKCALLSFVVGMQLKVLARKLLISWLVEKPYRRQDMDTSAEGRLLKVIQLRMLNQSGPFWRRYSVDFVSLLSIAPYDRLLMQVPT